MFFDFWYALPRFHSAVNQAQTGCHEMKMENYQQKLTASNVRMVSWKERSLSWQTFFQGLDAIL